MCVIVLLHWYIRGVCWELIFQGDSVTHAHAEIVAAKRYLNILNDFVCEFKGSYICDLLLHEFI